MWMVHFDYRMPKWWNLRQWSVNDACFRWYLSSIEVWVKVKRTSKENKKTHYRYFISVSTWHGWWKSHADSAVFTEWAFGQHLACWVIITSWKKASRGTDNIDNQIYVTITVVKRCTTRSTRANWHRKGWLFLVTVTTDQWDQKNIPCDMIFRPYYCTALHNSILSYFQNDLHS